MVELMLGLILTLAVGGVTYELLLKNSQVNRTQTEHVSLQDNVRSGALVIANELREVGYDAITAQASVLLNNYAQGTRSDLINLTSTRIRYFATRGQGFVCNTLTAPDRIVVKNSTWQAYRAPKDTDTLMVYVENANNTSSDDAWAHLGVVATSAVNCPDGAAGTALQVGFPAGLTAAIVWPRIVLNGPVRLTEVMEMGNHIADGKSWLGMRSVSANEAMQPVVGPLADSTGAVRGIEFQFRDANNATTAVPANVRVVEFTLRGVTDVAVRARNAHVGAIDTLGLTTRVALRNTLR
jgi:hypothetical protein